MFARRLKEFRENSNLTQKELAKKLNLTQSTIAYYENGKKMPTLENAKAIAEFFNTSLDYLLGVSNYEDRETNKKSEQVTSTANELSKEIGNLSPESQEEIKKLIELYKIKDMQDRNSELSDELTNTD